tara:strand:- start:27 stop:461 length:435 start_codon:yes stop_codon:yes gene_type:complete
MKKTIKELNEFAIASAKYLAKNPAETKFSYAIKKVQKRIEKASEQVKENYNEELYDLNVKYASVDEKGNLMYEVETTIEANGSKKEVPTQNLKFTAEKFIEKNKVQRELGKKLLATEIEFEAYIATEAPELTEEETETFKDFVL